MKKLEFKTLDFNKLIFAEADEVRIIAQKVFNKWYEQNIENAPIVYAEPVYINKVPVNFTRRHKPEHSLYIAKLVCIEEIKK